ncbi:2-oxoglutarate dehydrogenase E1 subunit family protein, partial [Streptomyces cacaoi]
MSSQSPNSSSSTSVERKEGQGKDPASTFGANEWLVDEIYQQYLQDPNSVDRAWWDFFADYQPESSDGAKAPNGAATPRDAAPVAKPPAPAQQAPASA